MAFLLAVPSITIKCERVFGLTAVWAHPHQAHVYTLEELAHKLVLLADKRMDQPYAFVWLNTSVSPVPLSSKGHVSTIWMACPMWMPGASFTNCRCANYCNIRTWWYAQNVRMANLKSCSLPSRNCPFGMLSPSVNLPMNCS